MHFSRTYGWDAGQNPVTYSTQITYVMNQFMSLQRSREHPTNLQRPALYVFCGRLLGIFRVEIQRSILFISTPPRSQNHKQSASFAKLPIRM